MSLQLRMLLPLLVLAIVGMSAALGQSARSSQMAAIEQQTFDRMIAVTQTANALDVHLDQATHALEHMQSMVKLGDFETAWAAFRQMSGQLQGDIDRFRDLAGSDTERASVAAVTAGMSLWLEGALAIFGKRPGAAVPTREAMEDRTERMHDVAADMQELFNKSAADKARATAARFRLEAWITIGSVVGLITVAVGWSVRMVSGTSRVLSGLSSELRTIASGDSNDAAGGNEVTAMQRAVERLKESLLEKETLAQHMRARDAEIAEALRRESQHEVEARKRLELERANERETAQAAADRATLVAAFQSRLEQAVDAAVSGDFSQRLPVDGQMQDLGLIATRMNDLMQSVETAVSETSRVLTGLAAGDLSARIEGAYNGVFADLKRDTNATAAQLSQVVSAIDETVVRINQSLAKIVSGSDALSRRTASQAASIETVAGSISRMAEALTATTKNASDAQQLSLGTTAQAEKGDQMATETYSTIQAIEESARKINEFTSAVEDIAFQTNILALNASVEAARAGQAGKGFAVVAQEVRELAQRAKHAANEIKILVEDSVAQVTAGSGKVTATRDQLSEIRNGIHAFADAIKAINNSCRDQLGGLTTISRTMAKLDAETRSNANLAEQSLQAANAVTDEAMHLAGLMEMFRGGIAGNQPAQPQRTAA